MAQPLVEGTIEDDASIVATESSILVGYSGDDNLVGSAFADQLFGGLTEWHDGPLVDGYVGAVMIKVGDNDSMFGGAGDDFFMVGTGTDTIDGGDNYDQINFQFANKVSFVKLESAGNGKQKFTEFGAILANVFVDLEAGTYSGRYWSGKVGVGSATGIVRNVEAVVGSIGDDTIKGSNGDNAFKPIGGDDTIDGRAGFDILSYDDLSTKGIVLDFASGTVKDGFGGVDRFTNIEHATGSKNDDSLSGTSGGQYFTGGKGDDTIDGRGGLDTLDYSRELGGKAINVRMKTGTVVDTFGDMDSLTSIEVIRGTARGDIMSGEDHRNVFFGLQGTDNLGGAGGNDELHGGDGNDTLGGGDGDDALFGDRNDDNILGGNGDDTMDGGADNDTLRGGDGDDSLSGGDGNDLLDGQLGKNTLMGGVGDDTLKGNNDAEKMDGGDGADQLTDNAIVDVLALAAKATGNNTLMGGAGNDTIKGVGSLSGGDDADTLVGMGRLSGDAGDDTLTAKLIDGAAPGNYAITLSGGAGNDILVDGVRKGSAIYAMADYSYASHGIDASLALSQVAVDPDDVDTLVGITGLRGTEFGDLLWGSDDILSYLFGGGGDDTIVGGKGGAVVEAGAGNDSVSGGSEVFGGGGDDTLDGGLVAGLLDGGAGNDTLIFAHRSRELDRPRDQVHGGANDDIIRLGENVVVNVWGDAGRDVIVLDPEIRAVYLMDFDPGRDRIDLRGSHFTTWKQVKAALHGTDDGKHSVLEFDSNTTVHLFDASVGEFRKGDFIL